MSTGNTKAQNMTGTISTESILISMESNWIQMRLRRISAEVMLKHVEKLIPLHTLE